MKTVCALVLMLVSIEGISQNREDINALSKIALNVDVSKATALTSDAKTLLSNKLHSIVTSNGVAETAWNPRFIITANITVGTKDIIPGPPQMIAQNIEVNLFIGDALDNKIYSTISLSLKGVGTNENKSLIAAIKDINPKRKDIIEFVELAKSKIINYFNAQCEFILSDAISLAQKEKYDQALYNLSLVPLACTSCYSKCSDRINEIYQASINQDGKKKISEANAIWASTGNLEGAEKAIGILSQIHVDANAKPGAENLIVQISAKLQADEKRDWEFKLKQYEDNQKMELQRMKLAEESDIRNSQLESERLNAAKQVALEYARNQPKTISYSNIYWH